MYVDVNNLMVDEWLLGYAWFMSPLGQYWLLVNIADPWSEPLSQGPPTNFWGLAGIDDEALNVQA